MNEKFSIRGYSKDEITLCLINKPQKSFKIIHVISIYRDMLSLNIEKVTNSMKEDRSIYVEDKKILLKISQTEKDSENKKKLNISIYNDKIIINMCITNNNFTKDVSMEIKCTDKIRYMVLMKVMYCLTKVFQKKEGEVSKNKNENKNKNKK